MLKTTFTEIVIIGGGSAGITAAISARLKGMDVIIIERDATLGGILKQCIHTGFGLYNFQKALAGPEYAQKIIDKCQQLNIKVLCNTTVVNLYSNKKITVTTLGKYFYIQAKAIVLATGSCERTASNISLTGTRPSGVSTAGLMQNLINLQNKILGNDSLNITVR